MKTTKGVGEDRSLTRYKVCDEIYKRVYNIFNGAKTPLTTSLKG
jgi:hypothetical protein